MVQDIYKVIDNHKVSPDTVRKCGLTGILSATSLFRDVLD